MYGFVEFYTVYDFVPVIMGRKECRDTLFFASVMEGGKKGREGGVGGK